jgi:hypothetical protein
VFNVSDASAALELAGIDISNERYSVEDVAAGMNVESEHGKRFPDLDVTGDDPVITAKIALAHLREFPDYYDRLEVMEREAEAAWESED